MFKELLEGLKSSPELALVVKPTNSELEANSTKEAAKGMQPSSPLNKNGTGTFASVPPPSVYGGPVPTPHINNLGPPPKLVKGEFSNWVFCIKSHLNHYSTNLWRIIEQGFYTHYPSNLTPREEAVNHYNHSALFILQSAVPPEDLPHLHPFTRAQDCWVHIMVLYKGSSSIQWSNYEMVLDAADEFVMKEDEDPRDLYRRVPTLVVALQDHGSKDVDDTWIKRKFLKAIMPFNKAMSSVIRQRPDFHSLSSCEVLDEFIAMNIMNKTADNALARVRSKTASPNLALKAKVVYDEEEEEEEDGCHEDTKYAYHEHMALRQGNSGATKETQGPTSPRITRVGPRPSSV